MKRRQALRARSQGLPREASAIHRSATVGLPLEEVVPLAEDRFAGLEPDRWSERQIWPDCID